MFKTFKAEFKHIFKSKWRTAGYFLVILIPFIYGFFYMNAFWNPFSKTQNLPVAIVNLDNNKTDGKLTDESEALKNKIIKSGHDGFQVGGSIYKVEFADATSKVNDIYDNAQQLVKDGKYAAIITIPQGYSEALDGMTKDILAETVKAVATPSITIADLAAKAKQIIEQYIKGSIQGNQNVGQSESGLISFYNSFKHSYLSGEMTNFGSGLSALAIDAIGGRVIDASAGDPTAIKLVDALKGLTDPHQILSTDTSIGKNINTYGFGLSPYFISIGIWVGAVMMTFVLKNERHIKTANTFEHYFGKSLVWVLTGWIQTLILLTAITFQGVKLGGDQWMLFGISLVCSTLFCLTVQAVAYSQRYGDLGEFAVVVMLVLQLVSSSGTFPVTMQLGFFKFLNHIAPFTYSILSMRETFWEPSAGAILSNLAVLLIFPAIFIPISLGLNYTFDRKTFNKTTKEYKSFEIELDDY